MKRLVWLCLCLGLLLMLASAGASTVTDVSEAPVRPAFSLPASLVSIGDEAFEGTSIVSVDLPETVTTVGDEAFARIPSLRMIRIPASVTHIGQNAFAGSRQVTVTASRGSYAALWSRTSSIPAVPAAMLRAGSASIRLNIGSEHAGEQAGPNRTGCAFSPDTLPRGRTGRPAETPAQSARIAHTIQGRAPPAA